MHAAEFVQAYPREVDFAAFQRQISPIDMTPSREWSGRFGTLLHDAMRGESSDSSAATDTVEASVHWYQSGHQALLNEINADPTDDSLEYANEINFHALNASMLTSWMMYLGDESVGNAYRNSLITVSQDALASIGLNYAMNRETVSGIDRDYVYFDTANTLRRGSFEGRANEFDAGIVLLEMMKRRKDIIVVPAPLQFEKFGDKQKTATGKSPNVDYLVLKGDQVVGVQVKSTADDSTIKRYDRDRVLILDASTDLGNQRTLRTKKGKSDTRVVTWGGLISVQRFKAMKTHGRQLGIQQQDRLVMLKKMRASAMSAGIKPYLEIATQRITERVDAYFADSAA